jgi:hypothetical protein
MSDKNRRWTKNVPQAGVSRNVIEPEEVYPVWDGFSDIPPRVVALEQLWYSLKVLVFGKTVTDAKTDCRTLNGTDHDAGKEQAHQDEAPLLSRK